LAKYYLEVVIINLTTDIQVPVVAAILLDHTGLGPAVSIGLKCDFDIESAIIGAIEEAHHSRPWMRQVFSFRKEVDGLKKISSFEERAMFWFPVSMINKLDFWIKSEKKVSFKKLKTFRGSSIEKLKMVIHVLKNKVDDIFFIDVTPREVKQTGFYTVKVIIPSLQPLYLDEEFPYLGGHRLYSVPKLLGLTREETKENQLNQLPHPFL